jgi:hypothetical protein
MKNVYLVLCKLISKIFWNYLSTFLGNFMLGHKWIHDFLITASYIHVTVGHLD